MPSVNIKLGTRVRRRNDIGMDIPGAVVRLDADGAFVFWPQDNFYELLPVAVLEPYNTIPDTIPIAA